MSEPVYETAWSVDRGWSFAPSHGGGLTTYAGGSAAQQLVNDAPYLSKNSEYVIEARLARRRDAAKKLIVRRTQAEKRARFTVIK